jgi:hypothetical protein
MPKDSPPTFEPYNPLDKQNLGKSIADSLLDTEAQPLPPAPFIGAGVYALYYTGQFAAYERISKMNSNGQFGCPIYVGKAIPAGARKGGHGLQADKSQVLYKRLSEHAESIKAVSNLDVSDFHCRFLVVDDIWIPLAESILIERFKPVWNRLLDGFGNHDPGKGRYQGMMPLWDCLHPGRAWAVRMQPCVYTPSQLEEKVMAYLVELFAPCHGSV